MNYDQVWVVECSVQWLSTLLHMGRTWGAGKTNKTKLMPECHPPCGSDLIGLGVSWAKYILKVPQVQMCSQVWELLLLACNCLAERNVSTTGFWECIWRKEETLNFLRGKDVMITIGSEFFRKNKTCWKGTLGSFALLMCQLVLFVLILGQHCWVLVTWGMAIRWLGWCSISANLLDLSQGWGGGWKVPPHSILIP